MGLISGSFEHGNTIFESLRILLCKDLLSQGSKERSFDINLSLWLTISECVACYERGIERLQSEWLLQLV